MFKTKKTESILLHNHELMWVESYDSIIISIEYKISLYELFIFAFYSFILKQPLILNQEIPKQTHRSTYRFALVKRDKPQLSELEIG